MTQPTAEQALTHTSLYSVISGRTGPGGKSHSLPKGVTDPGTHNLMPKPWRKMSEHAANHHFRMWMPHHIDLRQVHDLEDEEVGIVPDTGSGWPRLHNVYVHWFHDFGIGVRYPEKWHSGDDGYGGSIIYDEPTTYYKIGCDHQMAELTREECGNRGIIHHGNCWHVTECTLCGWLNSYDSSG